nr:hypothetical protein [Tanacetum cinerariifolium]
METLDNPFVAPFNIENIKAFMNRVGYQGVVDKKFLNIPQRIEEDYHSIKDDIPLVSVYTTRNVLVRGMLILNAFLTKEIHATNDFKEHETIANSTPTLIVSPQGKKRKQTAGESSSPRQSHKITIKRNKLSTTPIPPPSDDRERDEIDESTLLKNGIEKMAEGDEDEESYVSKFADSVLNDDVDYSSTRLEPESHKKNPEKETDKVVKEKDIVDDVTSSKEIMKE